VIVPEKAKLVRRAFELYSTGRYSLKEICDMLYPYGFVNKIGRKIAKSQLHDMLRQPFYKGYVHWRGQLYPGVHEPIVDERLFDKVQEVLKQRRQGIGARRTHRFAYSGLVKCGYCGCAMVGESIRKSGKEYRYYKCSGYNERRKSCQRIKEAELSSMFEEVVSRITIPPSVVDLIIDSIREMYEEEMEEVRRQRASLRAELERVKTWMQKAYMDKLEGKISEEFWLEQQKTWQARANALRAEMKRLDNIDWFGICEDITEVLRLASKAHEIYSRMDDFERREILTRILSNSYLYREKLDVVWREPFNWFAKCANSKEWLPIADKFLKLAV